MCGNNQVKDPGIALEVSWGRLVVRSKGGYKCSSGKKGLKSQNQKFVQEVKVFRKLTAVA